MAVRITPESAWQAALDTLQLEMPKAAFETWVRSARFVSYEQGVITLAVQNQYHREWLESRLTSTAARLLRGILDEQVALRFVVSEPGGQPFPSYTEPLEPSGAAHPGEPSLSFEDLPRLLATAITEPERVVVFPRYWLRFLPLVGSTLFWLAVAIWQARFLGTAPNRRGASFTATEGQIRAWVPWMSRATFWRQIADPRLAWLGIERAGHGPVELNPATGKRKQPPNRYRILPDIPLTPADAGALLAFLREHDVQSDPVAALRSAAAADPREILSGPDLASAPQAVTGEPRILTVQGMVSQAVGPAALDAALRQEIDELAGQVYHRLAAPARKVEVSWYFLQHALPVLGPDAGAFVTLMRSQGYYNRQSGEERDAFWVEGGFGEIARWMGVPEKTARGWLPPTANSGRPRRPQMELSRGAALERARLERVQAYAGEFVQAIRVRPNVDAPASIEFRVVKDHDPLAPADRALYTAAREVLLSCDRKGILPELEAWLAEINVDEATDGDSVFETLMGSEYSFLRLSSQGVSVFETLTSAAKSAYETLKPDPIPFLRLIKILKTSTQTPITNQPTSTPSASPESANARVVVDLNDLALLLERSRADRRKAQKLAVEGCQAWQFISWLVYCASPAGKGVENPVGFAIRKLDSAAGGPAGRASGAGGAYDRLAQRPQQLVDLIRRALGREWSGDEDWLQVMVGADEQKVRRLAEQLGII